MKKRHQIFFPVILSFMVMSGCNDENWKMRWENDTKMLSQELKDATALIATVSAENVKLKNQITVLEEQIRGMKSK